MIWQDDDGFFPHQRALSKLHTKLRVAKEHRKEHKKRCTTEFSCPDWHGRSVCIVSSQEEALELMDSMKRSVELYVCKEMVLSKGIGVGSSKLRMEDLCSSSKACVTRYWADRGLVTNLNRDTVSAKVTPLRSVVWKEEVYRPGDHVVVLTDDTDDAYNPVTWKAVVSNFFMHEFMGDMQIFFDALWYSRTWPSDKAATDEISGFSLHKSDFMDDFQESCRPVSRIKHKYMPIRRAIPPRAKKNASDPDPEPVWEVLALEMEDTWHRRLDVRLATCPPFPVVNDVMRVMRDKARPGNPLCLCVIRRVTQTIGEEEAAPNDEASDLGSVGVSWLRPCGDDDNATRWKATRQISATLKFDQLVCLESNYEVDESTRGLPTSWRWNGREHVLDQFLKD